MTNAAAALAALALVVATVALHYEALRLASALAPRLAIPPRPRILVVIGVAFVAHLAQILLYALAYVALAAAPGMGRIDGAMEGGLLDALYFSTTTFTTLGVGDLAAQGPLRIVAGIESLNGLVLIGWTASFTYISMEKFWQDHR